MRRVRYITLFVSGVLGFVGCSSAQNEQTAKTSAAASFSYTPLYNGDHWGCDTDNQPLIGQVVNSYGGYGACCDSHDACMDTTPNCYGDSGHWFTAYNCYVGNQTVGCNNPCIQCHMGVMSCLAGSSPNRQSNCVQYGNCGDARRQDNPFGCTSDQICKVTSGPFSICDPPTGNCVVDQICPGGGCYNAFQGQCLYPSSCPPNYVLDATSCTCVYAPCQPCGSPGCYVDTHCGYEQVCNGACPSGYQCTSGTCTQVQSCIAYGSCGWTTDSCGNQKYLGDCSWPEQCVNNYCECTGTATDCTDACGRWMPDGTSCYYSPLNEEGRCLYGECVSGT